MSLHARDFTTSVVYKDNLGDMQLDGYIAYLNVDEIDIDRLVKHNGDIGYIVIMKVSYLLELEVSSIIYNYTIIIKYDIINKSPTRVSLVIRHTGDTYRGNIELQASDDNDYIHSGEEFNNNLIIAVIKDMIETKIQISASLEVNNNY